MSRASVTILPPLLAPTVEGPMVIVSPNGNMEPAEYGMTTRIGEPVAGPGMYGHTDGLITIAVTLLNYTGRIYLEGSLVLSPGDSDWFALPIGSPTAYLQFPSDQYPSTNLIVSRGYNGTIGFTLQCNCQWLRARTDQSYFLPIAISELDLSFFGSVDRIIANYMVNNI